LTDCELTRLFFFTVFTSLSRIPMTLTRIETLVIDKGHQHLRYIILTAMGLSKSTHRTMSTLLAGSTFRQQALQEAFHRTKGSPFTARIRKEPENPHDRNAIVVSDASGLVLGYIPRQEQYRFPVEKDVQCQIEHWAAKKLYLAKIV